MRSRRPIVLLITFLAAIACGSACNSAAGTPSTETADGSTLRLIVGFRTGGPYDTHARVLARHLGRHLPGNPGVIVENMPGASGAVASKHLATQIKADGLTIGQVTQTSASELIASKVLDGFHILGSPGSAQQFVLFSRRSGITTLEAWRRAPKPQRFASGGPSTPQYVGPLVAAAALGLPIQMVSGYQGSAEMRLAIDSGEVDAVCVSLDAYHTSFKLLTEARAVVRFSVAPIPGVDAPDALAIAGDARARELLETGVYMMAPLVRFYVVPRGTPAARVVVLREALEKTWVDPQFLADARASGLTIDPVTATALEQTVTTLGARRDTVRDLRLILQPR